MEGFSLGRGEVCAARAAQPGEMKDADGAVCSLLSAFPWLAFEAIPRRKDNKFVRLLQKEVSCRWWERAVLQEPGCVL